MVQWGAFLGCGVAASLITGMFGVPRAGQVAVMLIMTAIPMAVLESTSTQNDLVSAVWIMAFLVMLLKWCQDDRRHGLLVWMGLALALAALTKGIVYLIAPAFLVAMFFVVRRKVFYTACLAAVVVGAAFLVVLSVGPSHLQRSLAQNASSSANESSQVQNKAMTPVLFASNLIRHAAVHWQTPSQRVNDVFIRFVDEAHRVLGLSMRDPRITVGDAGFLLAVSACHEYYAGNFLHFWVGLVCCFIVLFGSSRKFGIDIKLYTAALFAAGLIFVLYLRWQPWISRFHVPLFIIAAPVIGAVFYRLDRKGRLIVIAGILFLVAAVPWVVKGKLKPLIGKKSVWTMKRDEQYFINRPYLYAPFTWATGFVRQQGCHAVGLSLGIDSWEYPYWALTRGSERIDWRHVGVTDISREYEDLSWQPCAVIHESNEAGADVMSWHGRSYQRIGYQRPLNVYTPVTPPAAITE
jgi:4-amino-4-deoxy-L-arabinose transferase-like glycosyltransferase